jgi:hypothetical protein
MVRTVWHRRTPLAWATALVLGVGVVAASRGMHAQGNNQFELFIAASDATGAPVTDLKPEEIVMSENGTPGKVLSVEKFSLPVKLTITVDNGPQSREALGVYRSGLTGLVEALPQDMEVTLLTTAPQPQMIVRSTADRKEILRGITRFAPEQDESARFTDALVEYAERLEKDFKDKKLNYSPHLIMVSTTAPEVSSVQRDTIEKGLKTLLTRGARVSVAMTTTRPGDSNSVDDLNNGRQALIAIPVVKASRGKYEALAAFSRLGTLLPEWGKELAAIHQRQAVQFRVKFERAPGVTTPLGQGLDIRLTRPGLNGAVSPDGRFLP